MILDTSAVVALIFQEKIWPKLLAALERADWIGIGAPTLAETGIVIGNRLGFERLSMVHRFVHEFGISVIPFEDTHWVEAAAAYERFGRGKHRAGLNFGDCLSYATARVAGKPLLFVGNDFARTDLPLVALI
ncbi:type II toxin-antitoxin system VapC family toxin [bacterium]|nr:MAG: type II toxin-antitoxin system VapC family toxin [bacterium]